MILIVKCISFLFAMSLTIISEYQSGFMCRINPPFYSVVLFYITVVLAWIYMIIISSQFYCISTLFSQLRIILSENFKQLSGVNEGLFEAFVIIMNFIRIVN